MVGEAITGWAATLTTGLTTELATELTARPNASIDAGLRELELQRRRLEASMVVHVAVAQRRMLHLDDGHRSIKGYLRALGNWSHAEVARMARAAALVDAIPSVGDAWMAGHIGSDQVDELARAFRHPRCGDRLVEFVPLLLEHAEHLPFDDFRVCVQRFVLLADVDGAHRDTERVRDARTATVVASGDGGIELRVSGGDVLSTTEIIAVFQRFADAEFRVDVEARRAEFGDQADTQPLPRSAAQRRHDAIRAVFRAAAAAPPDGRSPEPVVNVLCDVETFVAALAAHGLLPDDEGTAAADRRLLDQASELLERRCETTAGLTVHPEQMLRAALAGHVRRVVVDSAGVVVDMGRLQRLFTGSARTAAQLLTRRCSHPGCTIPTALCDVDHMQPWAAEHGPTDQANADIRCGPHDRFRSHARWRSRRGPHRRIYCIRADGTVVAPVGERIPDEILRQAEQWRGDAT